MTWVFGDYAQKTCDLIRSPRFGNETLKTPTFKEQEKEKRGFIGKV